VGYWGQDSSGSEGSLASYCSDNTYDIIVLGFAPQFGNGGDFQINFAGQCVPFSLRTRTHHRTRACTHAQCRVVR
jgi:hypothetical protein